MFNPEQYEFNLDFNIQPNWGSGLYEVRARKRTLQDIYIAQPLMFEKIDRGAIANPSFHLDKESAQELMNALYRAGIRPTQTFDQESQLDSVKYHLEDMRKLVFKKEYVHVI